jgi:hypothetical protein
VPDGRPVKNLSPVFWREIATIVMRRHPTRVHLPVWVAHDLRRVTRVVGCSASQLVEVLVGLAEPRLGEIFSFPDRGPYPVPVRLRLDHETHVQLLRLAGDERACHGSGAWGIIGGRLVRRILIHFLASVDTAGGAPPGGTASLLRSLDLILPGGIITCFRTKEAPGSR